MKKLDELLSKFENGQERYKTDALFNRVIMHLMQGVDEVNVIDLLLDVIKNQQLKIEELANNKPIQYIITSK